MNFLPSASRLTSRTISSGASSVAVLPAEDRILLAFFGPCVEPITPLEVGRRGVRLLDAAEHFVVQRILEWLERRHHGGGVAFSALRCARTAGDFLSRSQKYGSSILSPCSPTIFGRRAVTGGGAAAGLRVAWSAAETAKGEVISNREAKHEAKRRDDSGIGAMRDCSGCRTVWRNLGEPGCAIEGLRRSRFVQFHQRFSRASEGGRPPDKRTRFTAAPLRALPPGALAVFR